MSNIRIKDLTTTAATTASDDFVAVDGTTNGTRKLNAYSPTFGGNLTASGGSITVSGGAYPSFYANGTTGGGFTIQKSGVSYGTLYGNDSNTVLDSAGSANLILQTGGATRATLTSTATTLTGNLTVSGTSGITATDLILGSSGPSAKSSIAARASRQGLVFDGTAGCSGLTSIAGPGTKDFTVSSIIRTTSTSVSQVVWGSAGNGFGVIVENTGEVNLPLIDTANRLTGYYVTANKAILITYVRSSGVGYLYANGVQVYTATDTRDFTGTYSRFGVYYNGTSNPFLGTISQPLIYNRALSAAEVVALYEAGVPAGADYNSASNTALNSSNFTASTFTTFTGVSATGFTATNTSGTLQAAEAAPAFQATRNGKIRVSFTMTGTGTLHIGIVEPGVQIVANYQPVTAGSYVLDFVPTVTTANAVLAVFTEGSSDSFSVSGFSVTRLGLLLAPDAGQAGNGYVWNDVSGNVAQISLPSSGVTWNVPSIAGNRIRGTTNTNGNQQLLGASVLLPAESQILHVRARSRSGTPSITIGTASGGAQIVASVALSTTWQNLTIALTGGIVSSADDIWIGSNSTDVVETDISWQPLNF